MSQSKKIIPVVGKEPDWLPILHEIFRRQHGKHAKIGKLLAWFDEPATEGFVWSLHEDGKPGYDGVVEIEDGDYLFVLGRNDTVAFSGVISPDRRAGFTPYDPKHPRLGQPVARGRWIHWTQQGWQPDDWAKLFFKRKPFRAILIKPPKGKRFHATPRKKAVWKKSMLP